MSPHGENSRFPLLYLLAQSGDVSLEGGVHSVEGLGLAEVFSHVIGQLFQLIVDLSHQLLPVVKVPEERKRPQWTLLNHAV